MMTLQSEIPNNNMIAVFLPKSAANFIVGKLREQGYSAAAVNTVPELLAALRSGAYTLAVTTRPDIDIVRNIRSIPVVNIEVFFHAAEPTSAGFAISREFDGKAFLNRIGALTVPRPFRGEVHDRPHPAHSQSVPSNQFASRCWRKFRESLSRRKRTPAKK